MSTQEEKLTKELRSLQDEMHSVSDERWEAWRFYERLLPYSDDNEEKQDAEQRYHDLDDKLKELQKEETELSDEVYSLRKVEDFEFDGLDHIPSYTWSARVWNLDGKDWDWLRGATEFYAGDLLASSQPDEPNDAHRNTDPEVFCLALNRAQHDKDAPYSEQQKAAGLYSLLDCEKRSVQSFEFDGLRGDVIYIDEWKKKRAEKEAEEEGHPVTEFLVEQVLRDEGAAVETVFELENFDGRFTSIITFEEGYGWYYDLTVKSDEYNNAEVDERGPYDHNTIAREEAIKAAIRWVVFDA